MKTNQVKEWAAYANQKLTALRPRYTGYYEEQTVTLHTTDGKGIQLTTLEELRSLLRATTDQLLELQIPGEDGQAQEAHAQFLTIVGLIANASHCPATGEERTLIGIDRQDQSNANQNY